MNMLRQIWLALDQLANALCGGMADETVSSRCWRCQDQRPFGALVRIINACMFWQNNHCRGAYAQYLARKGGLSLVKS